MVLATVPSGIGLPSVNGTSTQSYKAQDPRSLVGSYINQQIGGLTAGTTSALGGSVPGDINPASPNTPQSQNVDQSAAGDALDNVRQGIAATNSRINQLAAVKQQKEQAAAAASAGGQGGYMLTGNGGSSLPYNGLNDKGMLQPWSYDPHLSADRNRALSLASTYLGDPYVLGGTSHKGIDCSGLVMMVYNQLGFHLDHHASDQGRTIPGVRTAISNLQPGDLVAWRDGSHIAIYAGNGEIIEAPNPARGVVRRRLWAPLSAVVGIHLTFRGE